MPTAKPTPHLRLAAFALIIGGVACAPDAPTAATATAVPASNLTLGSIQSIINVQLRAFPTDPVLPPSPIFGYGQLQLRLNAQPGDPYLPPSPISPPPGMTILALGGRVFNEGGALYRGGGLYVVSGLVEGPPSLVASFTGVFPTDPCHRYEVGGAILVTDAIATDIISRPGSYQVRLDGEVASVATSIGGSLDGSAWGPIGARPETDSYFAAKVCNVAIAP